MAKKTKAADLSIEEKLEQALAVPGYEPYKIPDNWCWVSLDSLGRFGMGQTILSKDLVDNGIPVYSATEEDRIFGFIYSNDNLIKLSSNDIVIPARGNSIGYVKLISEKEATCTQTTMFYKPINKEISKYIYYYMKSRKDDLFAYHGNAIPQITINKVSKKAVALAPMIEQQHIVERIESLFSKLDEAKEKAQGVIDSFETRKAAILHKAFSGELTAKWREENGVGIESWESTKIGNMLTEIKYGTSEKSDYSFDGIPVFRIPNIGDMTLIFDDVKKIQRQECSENEYLSENDILIIRSNGSKELVGKCALVPKINFKCTYASFLIRLRMKDSISSLYTVWYLTSEQARKQLFNKAKSSAGIHNINSKEISDISIVVPSKPEQNIITATLERLITKEKETVIFAESVIDQIDAMKKAILARAFRGELGTNDPEEESAVEMLKQILSGE